MMLKILVAFFFIGLPWQVFADNWIDEDGNGVLRIDHKSVSFFSIGDNYYFDEIFTNVRKNASEVSLCFGFESKEGKRPAACLHKLKATPAVQNKGKVRALHVNTEKELFFTILVQEQLKSGATIHVSIDDGDLYLKYSVNAINSLDLEAKEIMKLNEKKESNAEPETKKIPDSSWI
jgi:hypothetical protein